VMQWNCQILLEFVIFAENIKVTIL
jgi:hypothetical protein